MAIKERGGQDGRAGYRNKYVIGKIIIGTDQLQCVRFTVPAMVSIIPPVLFEQLVEVDKDVTLDALVKCAGDSMPCPQVYFFAFIDPDINQVVGFLWTVHSLLKNRLVVYYMSFLPEYQGHNILAKYFELCKGVVDRLKLDKTLELYSLHANIAQAYGGKPSATTIWQFDTQDPSYGIRRRLSEETEKKGGH